MKKKGVIIIVIIVILGSIGLYTYIQRVQPIKNMCKPIGENEQLYLIQNKNSFSFVNQDDEVKMTLHYTVVTPFNEDGLSIVYNHDKADLIDLSCHLTSNFAYDSVTGDTRIPGYYFAKKNNKTYVINKDNQVFFEWEFEYDLKAISNDMIILYMRDEAKVVHYGLYEYKNGELTEIFAPIYNAIYSIKAENQDGFILYYQSDDHIGYMDKEGKTHDFDEVSPYDTIFYYNYNFVRKDTKWALMKNDGTLVTDYIYDGVYRVIPDKAIVKKNDKYAFIDLTGKLLTDYIYDDVQFNYNDETIQVKQGNLWGYLDINLTPLTDTSWTPK